MSEVKKTGFNTHRATRRGHAVDPETGAGVLVEEGDIVPPNQPIALDPAVHDDDGIENGWMAQIKKSDARLAAAMEEGLDPLHKDVDYTKLSKQALEALAAERGINVQGLSKADLVTAVKGADDPLR